MIMNEPAGGVPVGFRVTWDRVVPGLEAIPSDIVPLTDSEYDLGSTTKRFATVYADALTGLAALTLSGVNGLDVNPGSDIDADLITVGVTGAPRVFWDESLDAVAFTKGIAIGTNPAVGTGAIRLENNAWVVARNAANTDDVFLLQADTDDAARMLATFKVNQVRPTSGDSGSVGSVLARFALGFVNALFVGAERSIVASTTQSQGEAPLGGASVAYLVEAVANANDVVTLPGATEGSLQFIKNVGANTLQIFPASGDAIDGGSVDASITLAAGSAIILCAIDGTDWYTFGSA